MKGIRDHDSSPLGQLGGQGELGKYHTEHADLTQTGTGRGGNNEEKWSWE